MERFEEDYSSLADFLNDDFLNSSIMGKKKRA